MIGISDTGAPQDGPRIPKEGSIWGWLLIL
jgi:hypothetical protein